MNIKSIKNSKKISIIGLGYVGLPLSIKFGENFETIGFDLNKKKINDLKKKIDKNSFLRKKRFTNSKKIKFTYNEQDLDNSDYFIVTVQTPIKKNNQPDLSFLIAATKTVAKHLKEGCIVIYESTVYPGVTENICGKLLEKISGLKMNKDFFIGFSPERVSPGDKYDLSKISKLVSGSNKLAAKKIKKLYKKIIDEKVYITENIKIAELSKLIENAQRDINISFMNEVSLICEKLKIETSSVLNAASTKWNFVNFKPGLVGGHCISVDPFYLTHVAKKSNYNPKVILSGRNINDQMGYYVAKKAVKFLKDHNKANPKVGIMGLTFKENCGDFRGSKVLDIIKFLNKKKVKCEVHDPKINKDELKAAFPKIKNSSLNNKYDILIVAVAHNEFKKIKITKLKKMLKDKTSCLFDLKSIYNKNHLKKNKIEYWSL